MAATTELFSATTETSPLLLPPTADGRVRFNRDAYHRMVEIGILNRDSRVELIGGEILMMSPIGPMHGALVRRLTKYFFKHLPETIECSIQLPVIAGDHSEPEPEPDVALVRSRDDDYLHEHPALHDVVLLVEVAESSLAQDLGPKFRVYASSGVPQYWVIDVDRRIVLVHRDPAGTRYRTIATVAAGDAIAPLAAADCRLDLDWLFR